jgi:ATP/maltotriose-dependent transcriptional regulator MalT
MRRMQVIGPLVCPVLAELAERLHVAPRTASAHVEHILAKLGVGRRAEVAAWVATIRARRTPPL